MEDNVRVWHVTERRHLEAIQQQGLRAGSYWTSDIHIRDYYEQCVRDEEQEPVILEAAMADLVSCNPGPDRPGLQEPIGYVLGMDDEQVWEQWEESGQTWRDCLELIGSIRLEEPVPASLLRVLEDPVPSPGGKSPRP